MKFGFGIPTRGPMATPESIATLARQGEELGFAIISVSDHIIIPKTIASTYPYNESGTFAGSPSGECLEQLSLLSFLVGITSSARLLTSVMVLPHRPPVLTAKSWPRSTCSPTGVSLSAAAWAGCVRSSRRLVHPHMTSAAQSATSTSAPSKNCGRATIRPSRVILPLRQRRVCAKAGAEAAPAHLDRRRESGGPATGRTPRQCLVSYWHQPTLPRGDTGAVHRIRDQVKHYARRQDATRPRWTLPIARTGITTSRPRHCPMASAAP